MHETYNCLPNFKIINPPPFQILNLLTQLLPELYSTWTNYYYYYTLNSLSLFLLAKSIQRIFEISTCDVISADYLSNAQFQKISILPQQKGLEFPGGWKGSRRPKNLKKCMKLSREVRGRGGGGSFRGGGMDILWNYTIDHKCLWFIG